MTSVADVLSNDTDLVKGDPWSWRYPCPAGADCAGCTLNQRKMVYQALCLMRYLLHPKTGLYMQPPEFTLPPESGCIRMMSYWGDITYRCGGGGGVYNVCRGKYGVSDAILSLIYICTKAWNKIATKDTQTQGCPKGYLAKLLAHEYYHLCGNPSYPWGGPWSDDNEGAADAIGDFVERRALYFAYQSGYPSAEAVFCKFDLSAPLP